jgi:hypothetical protein
MIIVTIIWEGYGRKREGVVQTREKAKLTTVYIVTCDVVLWDSLLRVRLYVLWKKN